LAREHRARWRELQILKTRVSYRLQKPRAMSRGLLFDLCPVEGTAFRLDCGLQIGSQILYRKKCAGHSSAQKIQQARPQHRPGLLKLRSTDAVDAKSFTAAQQN
jgi:hypothetical protein